VERLLRDALLIMAAKPRFSWHRLRRSRSTCRVAHRNGHRWNAFSETRY